MTPRNSEDFLQDILDAIDAAQQFVAGMTFDEFGQEARSENYLRLGHRAASLTQAQALNFPDSQRPSTLTQFGSS